LGLEVLGPLLRSPGYYRGPGRVDFPGVLVGLRTGHAGDHPAEGDLDVVEAVATAIKND
jgi:hypothetical protein